MLKWWLNDDNDELKVILDSKRLKQVTGYFDGAIVATSIEKIYSRNWRRIDLKKKKKKKNTTVIATEKEAS